MYQDAGYGENWVPEGNNARRFDPYNRSCVVLGSLFAVGFVLIVIIVLSLIPIYISNKSSTTNVNIQTSRVTMTNYFLRSQSPFQNFQPQTILSDADNLQSLQAALTSMLQKDSTTVGSVVEIDTSTMQSNKKRRQTSNTFSIICNLSVTSNRSCSSAMCSNLFYSRVSNILSTLNEKTTSAVNYQQTTSATTYWLYFRLPQTVQSAVSFVYVDYKALSSLLDTLLSVDSTRNQPLIQSSTAAPIQTSTSAPIQSSTSTAFENSTSTIIE